MYEEIFPLVIAFLTGLALGAFYFGGLWLTIRKGKSMDRPAALFFISGLVRLAVVLLCFYLVMQGQWQRLLACLAGFIVMRFVLVRLLGQENLKRPASRKERIPHGKD